MLDANTFLVPAGLKVNLSSLRKVLLESTDTEGCTQGWGREPGEILNIYFGNFRVVCLFCHEQVSYMHVLFKITYNS